jgi:hypothetical protein
LGCGISLEECDGVRAPGACQAWANPTIPPPTIATSNDGASSNLIRPALPFCALSTSRSISHAWLEFELCVRFRAVARSIGGWDAAIADLRNQRASLVRP